MTDKKNPDYTASAVSITNPVEIEILLGQRKSAENQIAGFRKTLEEDQIYQDIKRGELFIADIDKKLVALIDEKGGYQDTDAGLYALRQRRISLSYDPEELRHRIPKWADAVISEVVDPKQVSQLIKSKLITEADVEGAATRKETTRIIIEA